jgi:hypothetical protein
MWQGAYPTDKLYLAYHAVTDGGGQSPVREQGPDVAVEKLRPTSAPIRTAAWPTGSRRRARAAAADLPKHELLSDFRRCVSAFVDHADHLQVLPSSA